MRRASRALVGALFAALAGGCFTRDEPAPRAEFGVLFGGDIQDRERFPLELDRSKLELGVRVTFPEPLSRDARVSWEIEKPTGVRGLDGGTARGAELGSLTLKAGERRADAGFAFRSGDLPGAWRVRVSVDGKVVLDRAFEVVLPAGRSRPR